MRATEPVSRIMTETVVVIDVGYKVSEALDCFFQYPIHHLPVVKDGRLAGMLSSSDMMKLKFLIPADVSDRRAYLDEKFTVEALMSSPAFSMLADVNVGDAAEKLIDAGVHAAPVVDESEQLLGIVTTTDIMRALLHGPPRRGTMPPLRKAGRAPSEESADEPVYRLRPSTEEYLAALSTAEMLHVEARDPRFLGKTLLYLEQRNRLLENVYRLADRFLLTGQDEQVHAQLLKTIHAAKRADEHATGETDAAFPPN